MRMRALFIALFAVVAISGCTSGPKPIDALASVYADGASFLSYEYPQLPNECQTTADCSVQGYFHEVCTNSNVRILQQHNTTDMINGTVCACVQNMCQWVLQETNGCPTVCPTVVPPHADFCESGTLVSTPPDQCGCEQMLTCLEGASPPDSGNQSQ